MRVRSLIVWLAAAGFFALFLTAGLWQWDRARQKEALFAAWVQVDQLPLTPFAEAVAAGVPSRERLQRTMVHGRYLDVPAVLLDNQQQSGAVGVGVYSAFQPAGEGPALLVARGFVPVARDRRRFPEPELPRAVDTVTGLLAAPPAAGLALGAAPQRPAQGPVLVTAIAPADLAQTLDVPLLPFVLLLDPAATEGFARDWHPNTLSPDRHRGYAVQWLGLAATVLVVTVLLTLRSRRRPT